MNNLILPFAFSSLILLLAQICPAQSPFIKLSKIISLCFGITYLGNLVYLSNNNLDISESSQLYCVIQISCYMILASENSNNKEEIRI